MPYLKVQTNLNPAPAKVQTLLKTLSETIATVLDKDEDYVMVALEACTPMLFAGDDAPLAYLELKSIGLPESRTAELSQALCDALEQLLDIPSERIYIEFSDARPCMWGWDRGTF